MLNKRIEEMKIDQENIIQKGNELNKSIENLNNEKEQLKIEEEQYNKQIKNVDKEREDLNAEIEEYNKKNKYINEQIDILNNLNDENLIIDSSGNDLKFKLKKPEMKVKELETVFKKVEKDANLILDKELELLAKNELNEEYNQKIIKFKDNFEENLNKIINNKHYDWENCFNKSYFANKYIYNSEDMNKIVRYNLKNNKNNKDFYYICEIDNINFKEAKDSLKNKKYYLVIIIMKIIKLGIALV